MCCLMRATCELGDHVHMTSARRGEGGSRVGQFCRQTVLIGCVKCGRPLCMVPYLRRHEQERLKPQFPLHLSTSLLDPRFFKDDISIHCSLPPRNARSLSFPIKVPFCHGQRSVPVRGKNRWNHFRLPSQHFRPISSYALFFRIFPLSISLCASAASQPSFICEQRHAT